MKLNSKLFEVWNCWKTTKKELNTGCYRVTFSWWLVCRGHFSEGFNLVFLIGKSVQNTSKIHRICFEKEVFRHKSVSHGCKFQFSRESSILLRIFRNSFLEKLCCGAGFSVPTSKTPSICELIQSSNATGFDKDTQINPLDISVH